MRRAVAVALVVLMLTGCTPKDRMSIRTSDGVLQFAFCEPGKANAIQVTVDDHDSWRASTEADAEFLTGTLDYGELLPGFRHDLAPEPFDAMQAREIVVELLHEVNGEPVGSTVATFDGTRLVEGSWLDQDGARLDSQCG